MKEKKVSVRFNEREHSQIAKEAQSKNISISAFLRNAAMCEKGPLELDTSTIKKQLLIMQQYIDELHRIYRNIDKAPFENAMEEIYHELM